MGARIGACVGAGTGIRVGASLGAEAAGNVLQLGWCEVSQGLLIQCELGCWVFHGSSRPPLDIGRIVVVRDLKGRVGPWFFLKVEIGTNEAHEVQPETTHI
jgi:hypothetical protein